MLFSIFKFMNKWKTEYETFSQNNFEEYFEG